MKKILSIFFSVLWFVRYSMDGVAYKDYPGLSYQTRKAFADTIFFEEVFGTAFKYLKFEQTFYATDTTKAIKMIWSLKEK